MEREGEGELLGVEKLSSSHVNSSSMTYFRIRLKKVLFSLGSLKAGAKEENSVRYVLLSLPMHCKEYHFPKKIGFSNIFIVVLYNTVIVRRKSLVTIKTGKVM